MNITRSSLVPVVLALSLIISGCSAPVSDPSASWSWPEDPPTDRIGWEEGYWYNESIAVNQSDGLNETELDAFVARTMARVEHVRQLEFREPVPVEVISREEYRNEANVFRAEPDSWQEQVYEASFLIGEDESVADVLNGLYGGAVAGYYTPGDDQIVIVSNSEQPKINRVTLAHELVHALQDQQFGFNPPQETHDARIADNGLYEGDAKYTESLYEERCANDWDCVPIPPAGVGGGASFDFGVYLTIYAPYSEGPEFVAALHERGGWEAVNDAYDNVPTTAEQIWHPETYPDEGPTNVDVLDRSSTEWSRFDREAVTTRLGEAYLYVMLWDTRAIDRQSLRQATGQYSRYNYTSGASAGWGGDTLVPYRSESGEFGYVWAIEWDTEADAEQFDERYRKSLLQLRMNAERIDSETYVIRDGPFADAFRIQQNGTRVTIVNAPSVEALDRVHASG
ncbi:hypothetical protein GL213_02005 [Halogeometricum borinquense]|uniref:DUF4157 domain-containing protein n=1 Tax=Halogeometricum borinquense TaxID=60847 RepID=A0A6C0UNI3_9EURY|nr:Hvo_1808 family surface protein [Halogeometricum borinquense]QIB76143.1 hypothetical protein G3I44_18850 [Halogeometricum borinquense]QIQ75417.1 hypothetical protein GL213_02005 [Halogeometricum borinquense]